MKLVHEMDKKHPLIGGEGGRRRMGSHIPCPPGCPVAGQPLEEVSCETGAVAKGHSHVPSFLGCKETFGLWERGFKHLR